MTRRNKALTFAALVILFMALAPATHETRLLTYVRVTLEKFEAGTARETIR